MSLQCFRIRAERQIRKYVAQFSTIQRACLLFPLVHFHLPVLLKYCVTTLLFCLKLLTLEHKWLHA